jgi:hypothetical protein
MLPIGFRTFQLKLGRISVPYVAQTENIPRLDVRQPHIIGPVIGDERDRVAAPAGRIDQDPAHAAVAHLGKDL